MPNEDPTAPVADKEHQRPAEERELSEGMALCLSGGGYRAMLLHLGGIIRLNELGKLPDLDRVSSVSGGSITAAVLGLGWSDLQFGQNRVAANLDRVVIEKVREMARQSIDKKSIVLGVLRPGRTVGQLVSKAYDDVLFHGSTLQDLPADGAGPRFVINATNVQTGKLFRFSRPYQGDHSVGLWSRPATLLADAVTASSAFPPVLSPHTFAPSGTYASAQDVINDDPAFRSTLWMSDGGVYDNLGLETAWKRYRTILVSDGGGVLRAERNPKRNWGEHAIRVSEIVDSQVRALRKRQLIDGYISKVRSGAYWSVRSDVTSYGLSDPVSFPAASCQRAQGVKTGLSKLDEATQRDLINWGYVIADTALRKWKYPAETAPAALPIG